MEGWERPKGAKPGFDARFVGYDRTESVTTVESVKRLDGGRIAMVLADTPFYAESGGQISDKGEIIGQGWRVDVDEVRKVEGRTAAIGKLGGTFAFGPVTARVPADVRRDTERNHTATHLLHAALRKILGEHVHQAGSLVAPDRMRFDFTHHGPVTKEQISELELFVNRAIWADTDVSTVEKPFKEAVAGGAMALFGEKYGDVVRVVSVPGVSQELCGGTHARNTGQIALFKIVSESGVAAGVRRIEAVTGPKAYELVRAEEHRIARLAELLKAPADALEKRVAAMRDDLKAMQKQLDEARKGGGDDVARLLSGAATVNGRRFICDMAGASGLKELQSLGDALREQMGSGVAVVGSALSDGKHMVLTVVTDDVRERGVHADALVKAIAAEAGGRGGGKAHMAQAGLPDAGALTRALGAAASIVRTALGSLNGGPAA
jgi:alanyl-tRNA synthetase